jgi:hypothetical protein
MPSIRPYVPPSPPERLSRTERRRRQAAANAASIAPLRPPATPPDPGLSLSLLRGRAALDLVLAEPCPTHPVRPWQPCWDLPRGVCGARVHRCLSRSPIDRAAGPGRPHRSGASAPCTAPRGSLGGRAGTEEITGYLCPVCASALESVGAIGPTSITRALVAALRARGDDDLARCVEQADADRTARGIVGWGALPPGTEPNARPWAHLDLPE